MHSHTPVGHALLSPTAPFIGQGTLSTSKLSSPASGGVTHNHTSFITILSGVSDTDTQGNGTGTDTGKGGQGDGEEGAEEVWMEGGREGKYNL